MPKPTSASASKPRKPRDDAERQPVTTDERFSRVHNDPRFIPLKRKDTRIKLDDRFGAILKDDRFSSKTAVDRYGRPQDVSAGRRELEKFYDLEDEDEDSEDDEEEEGEGRPYDPARGEGVIDTSEESESESEDEVDVEDEEANAREQLREATNVPAGEVSKRIAVVNLDWDNVRAVDLMKTLASFVPTGGRVRRVSVYPSAFGKERMEREEMEGPPREIFANDDVDVDEEVDEKTIVQEDKGEEFDSAKLRTYQLERLRYYYAVVECDTEATAKHIYDNCDGAEYEATANFFDLRFIPDETSFEEDTPRDTCDRNPDDYVPNEFVTDALQHSKVKLTWDEDDAQRKQVSKRAFSQRDIEENELKAYLASSDSESEDEDKEASKEKYRALLGGLTFGKKGAEASGDMEVTFTSGLAERDEKAKVIDDEEGLTTIEKYAKKEKERRMQRKERARLAREEAAAAAGITLPHQAKAKEPAPTKEAADLGFDDPFFDEPAESTKNLKNEEKKKKREEKDKTNAENAAKKAELELLMADDDVILGENGKKLSHFDMKAVIKAEKAQKLKKGAKRKQQKKIDTEAVQDDFEMNIKDPRFAAVFERHDYAIDPTNPKFVKTTGMTKLMEERRKRSGKDRGDGGPEDEDGREKKRKKTDKKKKDDVQSLVESIKRKSKSKPVDN
ncbi:pre-rRNA processing protein Esf1 [Geopyxis carbonaria]|nr:pre-rRNA processing protein Esf1 [Geopyxis carbonaria]